MSFSGDLKAFTRRAETRSRDIFVGVVAEARRSIVEGSELTGAPGQPVDIGFLKDSWIESFESPTVAAITTNVAYAPAIEDNLRSSYDPKGVQRPKQPPTEGGGSRHIKSTVGGNHSVKLTRAGFSRIVQHVTREVVGNG